MRVVCLEIERGVMQNYMLARKKKKITRTTSRANGDDLFRVMVLVRKIRANNVSED